MSLPPADPFGPAPELASDHPWQRLDPRMLLVYPVREIGRFIIPLAFLFVAGTATGSPWQFLTVLIPVALGLLRYVTTRFRIAEDRIELRRGLLSRHTLSAPLDRVRRVDLTSSPIHRVLGLTMVRIGTGTSGSGEELDLDGLPLERAQQLRRELLHAAPEVDADSDPEGDLEHGAAPQPRAAAEFDPSWLRFAPFTSSGLLIAVALLGIGSQVLNGIDFYDRLDPDDLRISIPIWLIVVLAVLALAIASVVLSVIGYVVTNFGYRLHHANGSWHIARGLLTTRETSLDDDRLAGFAIGEPLGLRIAGGARLIAIATGLRASEQTTTSVLVPPAPRHTIEQAAIGVGRHETPVRAPLTGHGAAATRRRFVRALAPTVLLSAVLVTTIAAADLSRWLLVVVVGLVAAAAGLAVDRARGLGHGLYEGHLVARSGSLTRRREVLDVDDVIGWNVRATWFQRRVGLVTLVATTAGGPQAITVLDIPEEVATRLTTEALPGLMRQFVSRATG